jgi:hypothetical protein
LFDDSGKRVELEWRDRRYRGTVTRYNVATKEHTVNYDDGDIKDYNMHQRRYIYPKDNTVHF